MRQGFAGIGDFQMLGFWDYTVVLTYISFAFSGIGIFCAVSHHVRWAIFFLACSGLCDMFDGKVARTKKNRTEDEKRFGIQIDSLCDMVCFGILPVIICYKSGMNHIYSIVILILYSLAGLIRLAYFNVMEEKRQQETEEDKKYYQGLPITSMAIALPLLFVLSPLLPGREIFVVILHLLVITVGTLFIVNFRLRKPSVPELVLLVGAVAFAVAVLIVIGRGWWVFLRQTAFPGGVSDRHLMELSVIRDVQWLDVFRGGGGESI